MRIFILLALMAFGASAENMEQEHRRSYFTPIERYTSHLGTFLRISEEDFQVRFSTAQGLIGRHSLMVRQNAFVRTFGRSVGEDEEIRFGLGLSLVQFLHTRLLSFYGEAGLHYTFGWFLDTGRNPSSQWLPDYSGGLAFPISDESLFKLGVQYMALGQGDDWKLETGFLWGF